MTVQQAITAYRTRVSGSHTPKPPSPFKYVKALKVIIESSGPGAAPQATKERAHFLYKDAVKFAILNPPASRLFLPVAAFIGMLIFGTVVVPSLFQYREAAFVTVPLGIPVAGFVSSRVAESTSRRWKEYLTREYLPTPPIIPGPSSKRDDVHRDHH